MVESAFTFPLSNIERVWSVLPKAWYAGAHRGSRYAGVTGPFLCFCSEADRCIA